MSDWQLDLAVADDYNYGLRQTVPQQILKDDISSDLRSAFFNDLRRIRGFYKIYFRGMEFKTEGTKGDYMPASLFYKKCRKLIDDEARFMFSNTPDINVESIEPDGTNAMKDSISSMNKFLDKVLEKNAFPSKLVKAAKDCFIAGRVCMVVNFNESGIQVDFINALEFYYEYTDQVLSKLIVFYHTNNALSHTAQRVKKKVYEMRDGLCWVTEMLYDGAGSVLEDGIEINTNFEFIPAVVIFNDGLTGDTIGESEIDVVDEFEEYYSKLANAGKDTLRKSMNGVKYIIDASEQSTRDLGTGPGAIWEIQSDIEIHDETNKASVGQLEPSMNHTDALNDMLDRVENNMYSMLSVPNITGEQLQGMITSGKTIRALYWPMTVRCGEKEHVWDAAFDFMVETIFYGAYMMPEVVQVYVADRIPEIEFKITSEANYALPDDENEERAMDLQEINSQAMSRKSYLIKWRGMTESEADEEIQQILYEKQLLEDGLMDSNAFGNAAVNPFEKGAGEEEEDEEPGASEEDDANNPFGGKPAQEEESQEQKGQEKAGVEAGNEKPEDDKPANLK